MYLAPVMVVVYAVLCARIVLGGFVMTQSSFQLLPCAPSPWPPMQALSVSTDVNNVHVALDGMLAHAAMIWEIGTPAPASRAGSVSGTSDDSAAGWACDGCWRAPCVASTSTGTWASDLATPHVLDSAAQQQSVDVNVETRYALYRQESHSSHRAAPLFVCAFLLVLMTLPGGPVIPYATTESRKRWKLSQNAYIYASGPC